jgi:predicted DNA-binding WGR domain protein
MEKDKATQLFYTILYTFQMQTMINLGKIANPATNKTETDLDAAAMSIDIIEMIEEKTKGNLTEDENRFLKEALTNLRLNYTAERNKPQETQQEDKPEEKK